MILSMMIFLGGKKPKVNPQLHRINGVDSTLCSLKSTGLT